MHRNKNKPATEFVQDIFYMLLRDACCEGTVRKCPFHKLDVGRHFLGSAYGAVRSAVETCFPADTACVAVLCKTVCLIKEVEDKTHPRMGLVPGTKWRKM